MSLTSQDPSMIDVHESAAIASDKAPVVPDLTYAQIIFWAAAIGVIGGLIATAYYYLLENSMHLVWHQLPELLQTWVPGEFLSQNYVWIAATIGGLLVGLSLHFMGLPGEVAFVVDKVHDPGRIEMQQTPAMIVVSLFSIVAGGSAGPEAPLVQVKRQRGRLAGHKDESLAAHRANPHLLRHECRLGSLFWCATGRGIVCLRNSASARPRIL
jgi:hypothetical protein